PLNYPGKLGLEPDLQGRIFQDLKPGFNEIRIHPNITLELFVGLFEQVPDTGDRFHSIFFDPFSPDVNPELWTPDVFRKLASVSDTDVLLSTYGAASKARAAMAAAGWSVARAPGALGKREMTLAALNPARLSGWKRLDETRLSERYQKGEFDEQRNG
ncbi:MAG: MnmC family methyltransferase, partial [Balneolaceae bacterium]